MGFWEVLDRGADLTAVAGLAGLGFTIWQIFQVKSEASAAKNAAEQSMKAISRSNMLLLVPQLEHIEDELYKAFNERDEEKLTENLTAWRRKASQFRGFLDEALEEHRILLTDIQELSSLAIEVRIEARKIGMEAAVVSIEKALQDMSRITDQLTTFASAQGIKSGGTRRVE